MTEKRGMHSYLPTLQIHLYGHRRARNVIAALLKRLTHRNPNVQLFALAAAEALSKNVGITIDREIASRAFTQGLEKLITDRVRSDCGTPFHCGELTPPAEHARESSAEDSCHDCNLDQRI